MLLNMSQREQDIVACRLLKSQDEATLKLSGPNGGNQLQVAVRPKLQTPSRSSCPWTIFVSYGLPKISETTMAVSSFIQQGLGWGERLWSLASQL